LQNVTDVTIHLLMNGILAVQYMKKDTNTTIAGYVIIVMENYFHKKFGDTIIAVLNNKGERMKLKNRIINYLEDTLGEFQSGILKYDNINFQKEIINETENLLDIIKKEM